MAGHPKAFSSSSRGVLLDEFPFVRGPNFYLCDWFPGKAAFSAALQELLSVNAAEHLDQFSHQAGPSGLMAGPEAGTIVTVEVLEEQDVVLPLWVSLELLRTTVNRATAGFIPQKSAGETMGNFPRYLEEVNQLARAGGALNLEVVSVIRVERQQSPNQHSIHWHPARPVPGGVTAEHASIRLRRKVIHL